MSMQSKASVKKPDHFPLGCDHAVTGERVMGWKRTYPAGMKLHDQDHLAVASGVLRRMEIKPEAFTWVMGCLVEDMSGVKFDSVDVMYLDYCLGSKHNVAKWIAAYAQGEGKERWVGRARPNGTETGWMYWNLNTYLEYLDRKDHNTEGSESQWWTKDITKEECDDTWYTGRTWRSDETEYRPGSERAHRVIRNIQARYTPLVYQRVKSGDMDVAMLGGRVKWKAMVQVCKEDGTSVTDFPSQWVPSQEHGEIPVIMDSDLGWRDVVQEVPLLEPSFVDRHMWEATLWALDELRNLLVRVTYGPGAIDEEEPAARVMERLVEIWDTMPSTQAVSRDKKLAPVHKMAGQLSRLIMERMADWAKPQVEPEENPMDDFIEGLAGVLEKKITRYQEREKAKARRRARRKPVKIIRESCYRSLESSRVTVDIDYASCFTVN